VLGLSSFKNIKLLSICHKYALCQVNLIFLDLSAVIIFGAVKYEVSHYETISNHFTYPVLSFFSSKLLLPQVLSLSSFKL
jgi:hypothetical protein